YYYVSEGDLSDLEELCEIRWISDMRRAVSPIRDFRAYRALRREIRGLELDIVHTHTSKAGVLGRFAAHAEGVPGIIHSTHGSIYEAGSGIEGVPDDTGFFKRSLLWSERAAGKRADFLTVLSERERRSAASLSLAPESRIKVVPNGIDVAGFAVDASSRMEARKKMGLDNEFVVVSVGRLSSEKGHLVLLDAFAKFAATAGRGVRLVIVGDGPEMERLKRLAAELAHVDCDISADEFGNVFFAGYSRDIRGFLASADLFVLPSLYEGFGIVLLEAMAAGVPVVASKTGGVPEIVADGVNGLLVEPGDPDALSEAMERLVGDDALGRELSDNAKREVEDYSIDKMLDGYFDLYDICFSSD
ncbi:MAG: glycosyltransferase family 4 protein, partial [Kiritimatiellaeota bacterium]|nr:glycosyltransferase family 4 protein [Kiritimatiellota bacterium]